MKGVDNIDKIKKEKYYNFEIDNFDFNYTIIRNLILINFIRNKQFNIFSKILVLKDNSCTIKLQYFCEIYNYVLENLSLNEINNITLNESGNIARYLKKSHFTLEDLKKIKKDTHFIIPPPYSNGSSYYDIVILCEFISIKELKKLIEYYCEDNREIKNNLKTHYIYMFNYTEYNHIYDYF